MMNNPIVWSPAAAFIDHTRIKAFLAYVQKTEKKVLSSYEDLHAWSLEDAESFWKAVWGFCGVIGNLGPGPFLENKQDMEKAVFFPSSILNFSENLLRKRTNETALIFWGEDQVKRSFTFRELYDHVSLMMQALQKRGLQKGDRVAGLVPNTPEALIAMLATAALGGIWASCSPDFGVAGILDRFAQIQPKFLIVADHYL